MIQELITGGKRKMKPKYIQLLSLPLDLPAEVIEMNKLWERQKPFP